MAKNYNRNTCNYRNSGKKNNKENKYTMVEQVAYYMGQVERGKKNPDSKISDSFKRGLKPEDRKPNKTLF